MAKNLEAVNNYNITLVNVTVSLPRIAELPITAKTSVGDESTGQCHGVLHDAVLVVPTVLFVLYLAVHAKKNLTKLRNGRSYIMISYYALLWLASALNLAWCSLQVLHLLLFLLLLNYLVFSYLFCLKFSISL